MGNKTLVPPQDPMTRKTLYAGCQALKKEKLVKSDIRRLAVCLDIDYLSDLNHEERVFMAEFLETEIGLVPGADDRALRVHRRSISRFPDKGVSLDGDFTYILDNLMTDDSLPVTNYYTAEDWLPSSMSLSEDVMARMIDEKYRKFAQIQTDEQGELISMSMRKLTEKVRKLTYGRKND